MVFLLCHDVFDNTISLAFTVRKCTIPRLPLKFFLDKMLFIYPLAAIGFNDAHKIGDRGRNRHPIEYMNMILPSAYS